MALGSTQPLTEMSTRGISWGKGGRCVRLTNLLPSCTDCPEILGASTSWSPKGLSRPVWGLVCLYSCIHTVRGAHSMSYPMNIPGHIPFAKLLKEHFASKYCSQIYEKFCFRSISLYSAVPSSSFQLHYFSRSSF